MVIFSENAIPLVGMKNSKKPVHGRGNIAAIPPLLQTQHNRAAADCWERLSKSSLHFSGVERAFVQCLPWKDNL